MLKAKRWVLKLLAVGVGLSPIALVVACHKYGVVPTISVSNFNAKKLSNISVLGDTRNVEFKVPLELTHYDPGSQELTASGSDTVFDIFAKVQVKVGDVTIAGTNQTFMPLELLKDYLAGNLSFVKGTLTSTKNAKVASVQSEYGSIFGFTQANIEALNNAPVGEWKTDFTFRYQARGNVALKAEVIAESVPANTSTLKTYVALDRSFEKDPVKFADFQTRWGFDAASASDDVTWTYPEASVTDLPSGWQKYVSGVRFAAAPITEANAIYASERSRTFAPQPSKRALTMELTPSPGYSLSFKKYDLTNVVKLQDLITSLDLIDEYKNADLRKVKLTALNGRIVTDLSNFTLPEGTRLEYQLTGGGAWFLASELDAALSNAAPLSPSDFQVRFGVVDPKKFIITDRKEAKPDVSAILGFTDTHPLFVSAQNLMVDLPASEPQKLVWKNLVDFTPYAPTVSAVQYLAGEFKTQDLADASSAWQSTLPLALDTNWEAPNFWMRLQVASGYLVSQLNSNLSVTSRLASVVPTTDVSALEIEANKLRADGVHNAVTWNTASVNLPEELANAVGAIEFTSGKYATQADAVNGVYSLVLPTSADFDATQRHFWMRLTPKVGAKLSKRYFDLTTISGFATVKSLVDAQDTFGAVNLSNIKVSGKASALVIDDTAVILPTGVKIIYSIKSSGWVSDQELKTYLNTNATTITPADLLTFKARLQVTDSAKYFLENSKEVALDTSAITLTFEGLPNDVDAAMKAIVPTETSTHNLVTWTNNSNYPASVKQVLFLVGDSYTTEELALGAPESEWKTVLPTSVLYDHTMRNLWAKVEAVTPYVFTHNLINLTPSSKIREIKSKIGANSDYAALDLSKLVVALTSATVAPVIEETALGSARVPGTGYEFSYKQTNEVDDWLSEATFITEATNNATFLALTNLKVRVVNLDPSKYVLDAENVKVATLPIAFRYDRVWTYKVFLIDTEASYSQVGGFMFFKADGSQMTKEAITNFTTNLPTTGLNTYSLWQGVVFNLLAGQLEHNFTSTEFYTSFRSHYRGIGTTNWTKDISPNLSYINITGDYTKTTRRYSLVEQSLDSVNFNVIFALK